MIGASQVVQTIGAIIVFSLILLTANRMILMNTTKEVESEAVGIATTIAQSLIKEAQTKAFDEKTVGGTIPVKIPQGFSDIGNNAESRNNFDDFDDYDGLTEYVDSKLGPGSFYFKVKVRYVTPPDFDMKTGSKTVPSKFKKMVVTVKSEYLDDFNKKIKLSHMRRYYKTTN